MLENKVLESNIIKLKNNSYPGRGIIIGMSPDKKNMIQVYFIMGRSINSKNRVFVKDKNKDNNNDFIRTKAYDESKMVDPSLVIYYPIKSLNNYHIITNGDQTETIYDVINSGSSFEKALNTRCYEPDGPNFTPRISGIISLNNDMYSYKLSILKTFHNTEDLSIRNFFNYEKAIPGIGHCIHTYEQDGSPLPAFSGEPYELALYNDIEENTDHFWKSINEDKKVSLLSKYINIKDGSTKIKIINKNI